LLYCHPSGEIVESQKEANNTFNTTKTKKKKQKTKTKTKQNNNKKKKPFAKMINESIERNQNIRCCFQ
jgi:hypothetical protein